MTKYDCVIVGAGASGLLAAISAAENYENILVIEKNAIPGRKLLITGKGRCNITNNGDVKDYMLNIFPEPRFLYPAFKDFFNIDIISLLENCNLELKCERGARYFPVSDSAEDVVNALYSKAKTSKSVKFVFNAELNDVVQEDNKIIAIKYVKNNSSFLINTSKLILCTGGKSYPATGSTGSGYYFAKALGHNIIMPRPALVPLNTKEKFVENLQGLSLKNISANLYIDNKFEKSEFGELLFTHFGLSGPVILTLSRNIVIALDELKKVDISIDFKPALDTEKLNERLCRELNEHGKMQMVNFLKMYLPNKAIDVFLTELSIPASKVANQINSIERNKLVSFMKEMKFNIIGHRGFKEAIITNGGIDLNEINPKTMESKIVSGLFFAGEIINLDANTGGYNLQIAFSTAWLAGKN